MMLCRTQIRMARIGLNLKLAELAEKCNVSVTALSAIERGAADPRRSTLAAIQRALETMGARFERDNGNVTVTVPDLDN